MTRLAIVAALAACTSTTHGSTNEPDGGGDVSPWLGVWNETGTQSTTCNGATSTAQIAWPVEITAGAEDSTVDTLADSCPLTWTIDGNHASLPPGQRCTVTANGVSVTVDWTQSSSTLSDGTITVMTTGSTNNGCSFMQQGTLTK